MGKLIDLTGQRFGRLRALKRSGTTAGGCASWLCLCECGAEHVTSAASLRAGDVRSCGCLHREQSSARMMARLRAAAERRYRTARAERKAVAQADAEGSGEKRWRGAEAAATDLARALGVWTP